MAISISILPERIMLDAKVWVAEVESSLFSKSLIDATMQDSS